MTPHSSSDPASAGTPAPVKFFARNRRDGARLLSSALVITVIGLVAWAHTAGKVVGIAGCLVSLYWWLQYRKLSQ